MYILDSLAASYIFDPLAASLLLLLLGCALVVMEVFIPSGGVISVRSD